MRLRFVFFLILLHFYSFGQESPVVNGVDHHHLSINQDSTCLQDYLLKAHWEARHRTFFMSTTNEKELKDDYAIASGAGIGLLTKPLRGFQVGISGFFIYNLYSSDIQLPDSLTLLNNRYEIGLFDIENPENKNDLDRLEELYLKYTFSKSSITVGKININTPFINPQDGRMRPTIEEGAWISIHESKKTGFNAGWIWAISPRSTVKWYTIESSLGVNPSGVNEWGKKSTYKNNIRSKGVGIVNFYFQPTEKIKINLWNSYFENVMNTTMLEVNFSQKRKDQFQTFQNIMYTYQSSIENAAAEDPSLNYIAPNHQSNAISSQIGLKNRKINTSISYTHITGDGRYLSPREWGKEPFYTFMPRERNEGLGRVNAFVGRISYKNIKQNFQTGFTYGYYSLPSVTNFRLNKYGMPSYQQINIDASLGFNKFFKGLELKLLMAYKLKRENNNEELKFIYNKVNMLNANFIIDFKI